MNRRKFLKYLGALAAAVLGTFFIKKRWSFIKNFPVAKENLKINQPVQVFKVKGGSFTENIDKLVEMLGGIQKYVGPEDTVIIKANGQWPDRGYTHTGCIKAVIDNILRIPDFKGEVIICDNVQDFDIPGNTGFDVPIEKRKDNWPDHNWTTLAEEYKKLGKPVAAMKWINGGEDLKDPGEVLTGGKSVRWVRSFFDFHGEKTYLAYPVFESPLTPGRVIDLKRGLWEKGKFTGKKAKIIFMPTLNNHGNKSKGYAGVTSGIKSFFGATEIPGREGGSFRGYKHIHSGSFKRGRADYAGELVGRFMNSFYKPDLFITCAIYCGHISRWEKGVHTNTVLACENPVTLDYVACKEVIGPHAPYLNPDKKNDTRRQLIGCLNEGIGTINPRKYVVNSFHFT